MNTPTLTIVYRGIPIGTVELTEANLFGPGALYPKPNTHPVEYIFLAVSPITACAEVEQIAELADLAMRCYGFLGPAAEPASRVAGDAACATSNALCDELELRDAKGAPVAGYINSIHKSASPPTPMSVCLTLGDPQAPVVARLPPNPPTDLRNAEVRPEF